MCARNSHSYTHLIIVVGIVREPIVWVFITSKYPGIHEIGLPNLIEGPLRVRAELLWTQYCYAFSCPGG